MNAQQLFGLPIHELLLRLAIGIPSTIALGLVLVAIGSAIAARKGGGAR